MPILYRPFDVRRTVYDRNVAVHRRERVSDNMLGHINVALIASRQRSLGSEGWANAFATTGLIESCSISNKTKEINYLFPLWLYSRESTDLLDTAPREKTANLAPALVAALTKAVGDTPSPEDTLAYIYAILYAPSYRARYADFLKRDFPRVPLTTNRELFGELVAAGRELVALHTMETTLPRITRFDVAGSNEVIKVRFTPASPQPSPASGRGGEKEVGEKDKGRVYINNEQFFDGVPQAVWDMHIGGYRVAEKWLKDRKGRQLSYDDLTHYQNVVAALARTLTLQADLDAAISAAGGWPLH